MGQRMKDEPIVYGDDCLLGFSAGKTPKYLYARFSKIVQCPSLPPGKNFIPPNGRALKLTQDDAVPCRWIYERSPWYVQFDVYSGPTRTNLYIRNMLSGTWYFSANEAGPPDEGIIYNSTYFTCTTYVWGIGGIAIVTWTPQATDILEGINLKKGNDLFMEIFPCENGKVVYKFCRLQDATNIKIQIQP